MILNNFLKSKAAFSQRVNTCDADPYGWPTLSTGALDTSGNECTRIPYACPSSSASSIGPILARMWSERYDLSFVVGTGNTEPTANDYCLENDVTANISSYSTSVNVTFEDGKFRTIATISGVNNTESDITISEVGVTKKYFYTTNGTSVSDNTFYNVLLIRHVLETPKVVPSGSGFTVTFQWDES